MDSARLLPLRKASPLLQVFARSDVRLVLLLLAAAPLFFPGLTVSGFLDNEGRYAEVAREMLLTGDWLTPHMNGEVFLNKPPLMFWLTALAFRLAGPSEAARAVSGLATLGTLALLYALGTRLWNARAGLASAAVFLTMSLTVTEARSLRPDALLTFLLSLSLWGALRLWEAPEDRAGTVALWGGVGLGVMTKGLLGLVLPVLVLAPALWLARRPDRTRHLLPWGGLLLAAALILPWHFAAGVVNDGFWWDYVVNQHFLVFFDRKFPRDHIPHPLWLSWSIFTFRLFPWVVLLVPALLAQVRRARASRAFPDWLPVTWFAAIALFFSFAMGRLEHHFIPAVPGAALLIGAFCANLGGTGESSLRSGFRWMWALSTLVLLFGAAGLLAVSSATLGRLPEPHLGTIQALAKASMGLLVMGGAVALGCLFRRDPLAAVGTVAVTFYLFGVCTIRGMNAVEPLLSARPLIRSLSPNLIAASTLAYEAGEEYQQCGVLDYYLQSRVILLEPPGFIPPTYLKRDVSRLFTKRDRFWADWARGDRRYLLFSDPQKPLDRPDDFPQPHYEVARGGGRVVLTNLPLTTPGSSPEPRTWDTAPLARQADAARTRLP